MVKEKTYKDMPNLKPLIYSIIGFIVLCFILMQAQGYIGELETEIEIYKYEVKQLKKNPMLNVEYNTDSTQILISLIQ